MVAIRALQKRDAKISSLRDTERVILNRLGFEVSKLPTDAEITEAMRLPPEAENRAAIGQAITKAIRRASNREQYQQYPMAVARVSKRTRGIGSAVCDVLAEDHFSQAGI